MSMSHSSVPSEVENEVSSTHTLASTEDDSVTVMSAGEKDAIATACVHACVMGRGLWIAIT